MIKAILVVGFVSSISSMGFAQEVASPAKPEPEYISRFYAIGADGKLVDLEAEKPKAETKSHNHFISNSVSSSAAVPNQASPVRLPPTVHFVIKGETNGMDPASLLTIEQLTPGKNERTLPQSTAKAHMFGGVKGGTTENATIPFTVRKYSEKSFEVIPSSPIPPGEYAIFVNGRQLVELDCFGVDQYEISENYGAAIFHGMTGPLQKGQ